VATGIGLIILILVWFVNYAGYSQATTLIDALKQEGNQPQQALESYQDAIAYDAMGTQEARERLVSTSVEKANNNGVDSEIAQSYFAVASQEIQAQIQEDPEDLRHHVFYGDLLLAFGQAEMAVEQFTQADKMGGGQKQVVIFQLAQAQQVAGESEAAIESYRRAYELDTSFEEPAVRYAAVLIRDGQLDAGDEILMNTYGTTTVDSSQLLQAYIQTKNYDRLVPIFEQRLQENQGDIQSFVNLAAVLIQADRLDEARQVSERAAELFPQLEGRADELIQQLLNNNPLGS
jgi:tetratricopeptide (TPR) repeat protein